MGFLASSIQRKSTIGASFDLISLRVQQVHQGACQSRFVFDQENASSWVGYYSIQSTAPVEIAFSIGGATGMCSVNRVLPA